MKQSYTSYRGQRTATIKDAMKVKDRKELDKFLVYCSIEAGDKKLKAYASKMLTIYDTMDRTLDFTLDTLRSLLSLLNKSDYLTSTKNDTKKILKRFLKWKYSNWEKRFEKLKDIKTNGKDQNSKKINADTLIKPDELDKLIRGAESLKIKAIILTIFETGARPNEILTLKWKHINLENGDIKIYSSKNQTTRTNPVDKALLHLRRYKQEYPFQNVRMEDFVFPSKVREKQLAEGYFADIISRLSKRVVERHIFPYLLRHTRLTPLIKVLSAKVYEKFADHSIQTGIKYYGHLNDKDVRQEMMEKVYNIEEMPEERKHELEIQIAAQQKQIEAFSKGMTAEIQKQLDAHLELKAQEWDREFREGQKKMIKDNDWKTLEETHRLNKSKVIAK